MEAVACSVIADGWQLDFDISSLSVVHGLDVLHPEVVCGRRLVLPLAVIDDVVVDLARRVPPSRRYTAASFADGVFASKGFASAASSLPSMPSRASRSGVPICCARKASIGCAFRIHRRRVGPVKHHRIVRCRISSQQPSIPIGTGCKFTPFAHRHILPG